MNAGEARRRREERRAERAGITDPAIVLAAAARFLEARPRSTTETRRRLRAAGYPGPLVDAAIDRLTELGLLDDDAFARGWIESRDRARPRGERALRHELQLRGLDRALVDRALAERRAESEERNDEGRGHDADLSDDRSDPMPGASADEAAAFRLLARRRRTIGRLTNLRARRQWAYALLARNGFDPTVARTVAARVADLAESGTGADESDAADVFGGDVFADDPDGP
ncbi:MAG TPA: regulatory protein RecX [Candidatus Saccharimonadales bacterium]|nr:regulatory protein RecX [Candidatus Saccharimonadales bacterium]